MSYRVPVEGGKYVFETSDHYGGVIVKRSGEPWCTIEQGSKAVIAMMGELEEARKLAPPLTATEQPDPVVQAISATSTATPEPNAPPLVSDYFQLLEEIDRTWRLMSEEEQQQVSGPSVYTKLERSQLLGETLSRARTLLELAGAMQVGETLRRQMSELVAVCEGLGVKGDPPLLPLDTFNCLGVTAHDGKVLVLVKPPRVMTPRAAVHLAAWLIVGAEMAGESVAKQLAMATVAAIEST